jgi:hypothetical protein
METRMSEETKVDITCAINTADQEYICEIVADYLADKGIEWDSCSFTLVAEYVPENGGEYEQDE